MTTGRTRLKDLENPLIGDRTRLGEVIEGALQGGNAKAWTSVNGLARARSSAEKG